MIFPQYTKTCEVLLDYPRIGGEYIEGFAKKAIRNILHENIDLHSRILISDFPTDGIKWTRPFITKVDITVFFSKLDIKEGNLPCITLKDSKINRFYQFL